MIEEYLKDLQKIDNIEAIALYSIDNKLLESWTGPNFNSKVLEEMSLHYFQVYAALDLSAQNYQEIVITHEKGHFYTRLYPDLLLIVVVKSMVEISLIRLISNVKIIELLESREFHKILKKSSTETQDFLNKKKLDESEMEYLKKLQK